MENSIELKYKCNFASFYSFLRVVTFLNALGIFRNVLEKFCYESSAVTTMLQ